MSAPNNAPVVIPDLVVLMNAIPDNSIVSRTVDKNDQIKAVLFGFDAGQELSEHAASQAAVIHILQGEAALVLDGEPHDVGPNTWVHMPARCKHTLTARTKLVMLLLLLGREGS